MVFATTCALLFAQPKTQKDFERYFLPTTGDTITIHKIDSMRIFLKNNGWDGKTFESWLRTVNEIAKLFPYNYDTPDAHITWEDAVEYGGLCVNFSVFNATAAEAGKVEYVMAVIRGAYVDLDRKGNVMGLRPALTGEGHMICFVLGNDENIYAGSRGLKEVKGDTVDGLRIWDYSEGTKNAVIYPLLKSWPEGVGHGTNVLASYFKWALENNQIVKINTDNLNKNAWRKTWLITLEYLKRGYIIIFTRGEDIW
ncbi:MAG: hypothetical protein QXL47_00390 [Candidatus Anstonellales archaeon]